MSSMVGSGTPDWMVEEKNPCSGSSADASVLSTLRLFNLEKIARGEAVIAVTLALMANLIFKIGLVLSIGGGRLARHALPGLIAIGGGMAGGLLLI